MNTLLTCPRRTDSIKGADIWERTRWVSTPGILVYWPEGRKAQRPRTCSHCHGAHPKDVFTLLDAGWEDDDSRQHLRTRGYLLVPGTRAEKVASDKSWYPGTNRKEDPMPQPFPLLYFYVDHFTEDQIAQLNTINEDMHKRLPKPR